MAAEGLVARLVRPPPPHRATRSCRGTTSRAGLHKDFLWDDWQAALAGSGVEDCRWTPCYDCGVCTGYGIEHVVASPVAAGRRQPGHRPGPRQRRRRPGQLLPERRPREAARSRYTKLGKVRFTSHRDTARIWERALRRAGLPVADTSGFTPRPRMSFGLALPTGRRVDRRVPRRRMVDGAIAPEATSDGLPDAPRRDACPSGSRCSWSPSWRRARSLQEVVTSCTVGADGCRRVADDAAAAVDCCSARRAPARTGAQGRTSRRRRPPAHPVAGDVRRRRHDGRRAGDRRARPAAGRAGRAGLPGRRPVGVRVLRTHQWIEHDGEPARGAGAAGRRAGAHREVGA